MLHKDFLTAEEFREVVKDKIFSAEFEKLDGTIRKIVCRLKVTAHLKGGEMTYDPKTRNNLVVFDMKIKQYRTIPFDRLRNIKYNGLTETFEE